MSDEVISEVAPAVESVPEAVAPVAEVVVEAVKEEIKAEPVQDPRFASKLAHLTKKERDIFRQEESLKASMKEFESLKAEKEALMNIKSKAKSDPISFLREHGLQFEDVVNFVTEQGGVPTPPDPFKLELEELKAQLNAEREERKAIAEEIRQAKADKEQIEYTSKLKEYMSDLTKAMDNYPLTKANTQPDAVAQLINELWEESGRTYIPTYEEALQSIEDNWERTLDAMKDIPKVRERFGFVKQAIPEPIQASAAKSKPAVKEAVTLSNKSGSGMVTKSLEEMSLEERRQLAISGLQKSLRAK